MKNSTLLKRIWNSPTITTWMSYIAQMSGLILVLPLVLKNFDEGDTALWFLFSSFIALQSLADFGFKNTFSRGISFAMGGAKEIKIFNVSDNTVKKGEINWSLIEDIISTSRVIYFWLAIGTFFLMLTLGSYAMLKPFSYVIDKHGAYIAWGVLILVSTIRFYGNVYIAYLEGTNQIPLYKRWEALTFLGGVLSSFIVLLLDGSLLGLVVVNQFWVLIAVVRNKFLCNYIFDKRFKYFKRKNFKIEIFNSIWPAAWRSGVAGLMNFGLVNLSGLLYAQIGSVSNIASYLLSIRILNSIRGFSMAPFYSKLPLLARLRAEGNINTLVKKSMSGMRLSHLTFTLGIITVGFSADFLLKFIGSKTAFVSPLMWGLLSLAYFIQRYGAMHLQLYLTTHHVISHIADSVAGIIFVLVSLLLIKSIDLYAFPIGMISGYLGFYAWFSARYSLRSIKMSFFEFEKKTALPATLVIAMYLTYIFIH